MDHRIWRGGALKNHFFIESIRLLEIRLLEMEVMVDEDEYLRCKEELPWDLMYPWLTPVRLMVEKNKAWSWSTDAGTSVRVKNMLSDGERTMVQVATIAAVDWVLAADLETRCVVLLIRNRPSFFIHPKDPWCDWAAVQRILTTYSVPTTWCQSASDTEHRVQIPFAEEDTEHDDDDEEEEEEEEQDTNHRNGCHVFDNDRHVSSPDDKEGCGERGQEDDCDMASRGHYLAITPISTTLFDRVPRGDHRQVHHVYTDAQAQVQPRFGFSLSDTHSPRLSVSGPGDFLSWGDA